MTETRRLLRNTRARENSAIRKWPTTSSISQMKRAIPTTVVCVSRKRRCLFSSRVAAQLSSRVAAQRALRAPLSIQILCRTKHPISAQSSFEPVL